jgi:cyclopropane fatty-acyl-phospholipid synthase-like methyltransferase
MPDALTMYRDGRYLEVTGGTWDLCDSPFKAAEVLRMLSKHNIQPSTVCDIGCGAGGVLREMQQALPPNVQFTGYDVSPQALEISKQFVNERCRFLLDNPFTDGLVYDVALALDVFEHVEDCFGFLRQMKTKARHKIYHIPLEVHASAALRGIHSWPAGHLHQFNRETALKTIEHSDQEVLDWWFTGPAFSEYLNLRSRLTHLVRKPLAALAGKKFSARLLGGYSLLVLSK